MAKEIFINGAAGFRNESDVDKYIGHLILPKNIKGMPGAYEELAKKSKKTKLEKYAFEKLNESIDKMVGAGGDTISKLTKQQLEEYSKLFSLRLPIAKTEVTKAENNLNLIESNVNLDRTDELYIDAFAAMNTKKAAVKNLETVLPAIKTKINSAAPKPSGTIAPKAKAPKAKMPKTPAAPKAPAKGKTAVAKPSALKAKAAGATKAPKAKMPKTPAGPAAGPVAADKSALGMLDSLSKKSAEQAKRIEELEKVKEELKKENNEMAGNILETKFSIEEAIRGLDQQIADAEKEAEAIKKTAEDYLKLSKVHADAAEQIKELLNNPNTDPVCKHDLAKNLKAALNNQQLAAAQAKHFNKQYAKAVKKINKLKATRTALAGNAAGASAKTKGGCGQFLKRIGINTGVALVFSAATIVAASATTAPVTIPLTAFFGAAGFLHLRKRYLDWQKAQPAGRPNNFWAFLDSDFTNWGSFGATALGTSALAIGAFGAAPLALSFGITAMAFGGVSSSKKMYDDADEAGISKGKSFCLAALNLAAVAGAGLAGRFGIGVYNSMNPESTLFQKAVVTKEIVEPAGSFIGVESQPVGVRYTATPVETVFHATGDDGLPNVITVGTTAVTPETVYADVRQYRTENEYATRTSIQSTVAGMVNTIGTFFRKKVR